MSLWSFTEFEIVAVLFAVSGLLLVLTLHLVVRSSPPPPRRVTPPEEERPQPIELVREEGYEVIELYDDFRVVPLPPEASSRKTETRADRPVVRTAKVLDPESGQVRLLRVLTPRQTQR